MMTVPVAGTASMAPVCVRSVTRATYVTDRTFHIMQVTFIISIIHLYIQYMCTMCRYRRWIPTCCSRLRCTTNDERHLRVSEVKDAHPAPCLPHHHPEVVVLPGVPCLSHSWRVLYITCTFLVIYYVTYMYVACNCCVCRKGSRRAGPVVCCRRTILFS